MPYEKYVYLRQLDIRMVIWQWYVVLYTSDMAAGTIQMYWSVFRFYIIQDELAYSQVRYVSLKFDMQVLCRNRLDVEIHSRYVKKVALLRERNAPIRRYVLFVRNIWDNHTLYVQYSPCISRESSFISSAFENNE